MSGDSTAAETSGSFDWRQPPFAGGRNGAQVGLHPVAQRAWLTPLQDPRALARKQATLTRHPQTSSAVWSMEGAQQMVCRGEEILHDMLGSAQLPQRAPEAQHFDGPLMTAALSVCEDLCLMWHVAGEYRLLAANLCMPSYWSLASKLGQGLMAIHAPVADLTVAQHQRMATFFSALPQERIFERRNWFLHGSGNGFEPKPDAVNYVSYAGPWFLRSERQTLRRLDSELVLFAIRVDLEPLQRIADFPIAQQDLRLALNTLEGDALADFGGAAKRQAALLALRASIPLRTADF